MLTLLLVAEGYRIDHCGNVIATTYADLREPGTQYPLPALVKGCRLEHRGDRRIATYDPPFTLPWIRRNEALVSLR